MPARQVYGKRAGGKTPASFANFISPDRDEVKPARKNDAKAARRAAGREATKAIQELEKGLKDLALAGEREFTAKLEKKRPPRKADDNVEDVIARSEKNDHVIDLTDDKMLSKSTGAKLRHAIKLSKDEEEHTLGKTCSVVDLTGDLAGLALSKDKHESQRKTQPDKSKNGTSFRQSKAKTDADAPAAEKEQTNAGKSLLASTVNSERQRDEKRVPLRELNKQFADAASQNESEQLPPPSPARARKLKSVTKPKRPASSMMPTLPTPELTPEPEDPYTAYVSSLLSQSFGGKIVSFEEWSAAIEPHFDVSKIAEASYSEVYRLTAASAANGSTEESVLKLIALKTPPNAACPGATQKRGGKDAERRAREALAAREENDKWKSHVDDVHSEIKLLQNLNDIPGFTNFRELTVLQGRPSTTFVEAWKSWNKARPRGKKSEFPDPSKKTSYDATQLWAVIEMQDAGTDCEKVMAAGGLSTIWEVWDVFWGVCLSVAKAEETCKFEHRDLHLENICIRSSRSQSEQDLITPFIKDPLHRKLGFTGLDTTVIDYTLSRAEIIPSAPASPSVTAASPPPAPEIAFLDLDKDPSLFEADASGEYQYEIYRYMRGIVLHKNPLHPTPDSTTIRDTPRRSPGKTPQHIRFDDAGNPTQSPPASPSPPSTLPTPPLPSTTTTPWRAFHPQTNLIWAHFLLHQLLAHLSAAGAEPAALSIKHLMRNVEARIEDAPRVVRRARKLHAVLVCVAKMLSPQALGAQGGVALQSVGELVVLAIEERWVRVGDVVGE